jgi:hypothetical protein
MGAADTPMNPDHLLDSVAHDIERWAEDALAQIAHEIEDEALLRTGDHIALACSCGVTWQGRIEHDAAQTLTRNWHLVHCGPGHNFTP